MTSHKFKHFWPPSLLSTTDDCYIYTFKVAIVWAPSLVTSFKYVPLGVIHNDVTQTGGGGQAFRDNRA